MKFFLHWIHSALLANHNRRAIAGFVAVGMLLYLLSVVWVGWHEVNAAFYAIGFYAFLMGCILTAASFLVRFGRWAYSLRSMAVPVPHWHNLGIYLAGLTLTATPGKAGELLRCALLQAHKVPFPKSAAAFLVDRGSDVLGICLLGALAALFIGHPWAWLWVLAFLSMTLVSCLLAHVLQSQQGDLHGSRLVTWLSWGPVRTGLATLHVWASVWSPGRVVLFSGLAMLAYGTQALVFFWFCSLLQTGISAADCVLMFVQATLFGAASMLPAGLGAMEAALVFQLVDHGVASSTALSLAISIRLVTLWFGMSIGALSLLMWPGEKNEIS